MKTEFIKASNPSEGEYVHLCDPGKRPYAKVNVISIDETEIVCPLCGHTEIHPSIGNDVK